jgi:hypothetical protein
MEGLAISLLERVLRTLFSKRQVEFSAGGGLHMLAQPLMAQLLPLQQPRVVKVASDKENPSEI